MTSTAESRIIYLTALVQGLALITFPAASVVFTSRTGYGLSAAQYGRMFLPQVVAVIAGSLLGPSVARRITTKAVYRYGLALSLASMAILMATAFVESVMSIDYPLLGAATALLGAGFGLTFSALHTYAGALHPVRTDSALLVLTAVLGLGMLLAPGLEAAFQYLGTWWALPVLSAASITALLAASSRLPTGVGPDRTGVPVARPVTSRHRLYMTLAVLYGICVVFPLMWSHLSAARQGTTVTSATLMVAAFWGGALVLGRAFFAGLERWPSAKAGYHLLPFVLLGGIAVASLASHHKAIAAAALLFLAAVACSALIPLLSGQREPDMTVMAAAATGAIICYYPIGYGVASASFGALRDTGMSSLEIFATIAAFTFVLCLLSLVIVTGKAGASGWGSDEIVPDLQNARR
jgi:hypothetical protein